MSLRLRPKDPPRLSLHLLALPELSGQPWDTSCLSLTDLNWIAEHRGPGARLRATASRLLIRTVLADTLGCTPGEVPLAVTDQGRPVLAGESDERSGFSVSHDSRLLVFAEYADGCGVDVEDCEPELLHEVAARFCVPGELAGIPDPAAARALFSAKESVAKAYGLGLAARLSGITFVDDPGAVWSMAHREGEPTGLLTRVHRCAQRHLAMSVRADVPPLVSVTTWRVRSGRYGRQLDRAKQPVGVGG